MLFRILHWLFLAQLLGMMVCAVLMFATRNATIDNYLSAGFIFLLMSNFLVFFLMDRSAKYERRVSLSRSEDGIFIWIDRRGNTCRSEEHPGREGGEWDCEDEASGWSDCGDGDGDGGGDGGGGD